MVFDISVSLPMSALSHPGVLQLTLHLLFYFFYFFTIMQVLPNLALHRPLLKHTLNKLFHRRADSEPCSTMLHHQGLLSVLCLAQCLFGVDVVLVKLI